MSQAPVVRSSVRARALALLCRVHLGFGLVAGAAPTTAAAVPQLSQALRGVASRTGVRFLDLARATEGREACTRASSQWGVTPLIMDYSLGPPPHWPGRRGRSA